MSLSPVRRVVLVLAGLLVVLVLGAPAGAGAAGDATEAFCANEALPGFESFLPDCRAYEMVSPPFKDGQAIEGVSAMSSDGSRMILSSYGVFADDESGSGVAASTYVFARSPSGWVASSASPPASLFPYSEYLAASSDLSRVLFRVRASSESVYAVDLYVREPDGSQVEVGPMVPPSLAGGPPSDAYALPGPFTSEMQYVGASADLSHVLFQMSQNGIGNPPLWPGDTTPEGSPFGDLYEYVGRGNTRPAMVGVNAEGR